MSGNALLEPLTDFTKPADVVSDTTLDRYCFVNIFAVKTLVSALLCPSCVLAVTEVGWTRRKALSEKIFVTACNFYGDIGTTPQSVVVEETQQNKLSACLCAVGKNCGVSFTKRNKFVGGINAPPLMHLKSCQEIAGKVHDAPMAIAQGVMMEAVTAVRRVCVP